jgi:hypothetical protein
LVIHTEEHDFFLLMAEVVRRIQETHLLTLFLGGGSIATLAFPKLGAASAGAADHSGGRSPLVFHI